MSVWREPRASGGCVAVTAAREHVEGACMGRGAAERLIAWCDGDVVSFSPPRIIDQRFEKVSYFVFGDFNFRLDSKSVVEVGTCPSLARALTGRISSVVFTARI